MRPMPAPTPPPRDNAWRGSIRRRLALGMMTLLLVVLGLVGGTLYTLLHQQTDARVRGEFSRVADEFRVLATRGVDPSTGRPFTDPEALLKVSLERTVVAPSESVMGLVDGKVTWAAPEGVVLRTEEDPQLVEHVAALSRGQEIVDGVLTTEQREYRYLVAPVQFAGNEKTGALVIVADMVAERAQLTLMMQGYLWVSLASLLAAWALVALWVRHLLRPIAELRDTAARISNEDLSERVLVRGDDELAHLATTVNQMLDRIEAGVAQQRSLLDDVGHELRTPITVVRGHLELMDGDDATDVRETRAIALDELDRMSGLVTDVLTLAKSSQPDFLNVRRTELAPLTDAVLTKARALGDQRWVMSRVADTDALVDPERITQAWLQLAENAVKYSEPDTPIQVGSRVSLGEAYLWVADQGMGIAPEDLALIRSRFGRAGNVRGRIEGSGLGLAIVDSIAEAHGGHLDVDSEPGVGSTFTIVIPLNPARGLP